MEEKTSINFEWNNETSINQIIEEIIALAKNKKLDELDKKIKENINILLSEKWLKAIINVLKQDKNNFTFKSFLEALFEWNNTEEKLDIIWKIFVLSALNAKELIQKIENTKQDLIKTLSNTKEFYFWEIEALQEIVFGLEKTIKKLNKENEKLTRTINKISKLFQINTNDPYHLLLFLKDFKTKSKKVTELVKELENLWILEKNQHNEIVISPKIISYLKEFKENKLVTPKIKNKKTFYVNTNIVIKKDNQIHKIKKYRMNKIEDKEKEKLKNEVTNLENDLKEKNNKISYLEQENQKLKEKLAEKEKFIKEQNKKIEELIQKLENLEKTENNQTLTKEQIEALKAYKEYQKN